MYRYITHITYIFALVMVLIGLSTESMQAQSQYTPPDTVTLEMYQLFEGNGGNLGIPCRKGDQIYGCTADTTDPERAYPFDTAIITIGIENHPHNNIQQGYLHNVVPSETNPQSHNALAVQAQSVAARSFAYFELAYPTCSDGAVAINNSTEDQVYIPFMYESQPGAEYKATIDQAVSKRYYMSYAQSINACGTTIATDRPIFSEFSADAYLATIDHPEQSKYPYMQGVPDPISSHPEVPSIVEITNSHQRGLSQNGASRWANGNLTSNPTGNKGAWSVQWLDQSQILTHYYTGIHLRNANASNTILTPDARWVPLKVRWGTSTGNPPGEMCAGSAELLEVWVQNSGTTTWPSGGAVVFGSDDLPGQQAQASAANGSAYPLQPVAPGATYTATLLYQAPTGVTDGYIAGPRFEMYQGSTKFSQLQPGLSWPDYSVQITIRECDKQVYLPLIQDGGVVAGQ